MLALDGHLLAPVVRKLQHRSRLGSAEIQAFLSLPYSVESSEHGTYIVREGDKVEQCVALLSGFMFRSKITGSGARQILGVQMRGDLVDLQNSLLDKADHSVQALTKIKIARIPREAIIALIDASPAIALALWRDTLVDASLLREWTLNIGQRNARQRVAHLLCEIATRQEVAGISNGPRYEWPVTQEQIGNATGMTNIHANRMMRSLQRDGLVGGNGGGVITIKDWHGLMAAGDFDPGYLHEKASNTIL